MDKNGQKLVKIIKKWKKTSKNREKVGENLWFM